MHIKRKTKKILLVIATVSILLLAFFYWQNNSITINRIVVKNEAVPESFHGYKILQLSDLHNKEFGNKQKKLLDKIENVNPDVIYITGDLIDSNHTNLESAMELVNGAIKICPIYYVSGNHEAWSGSYETLKSRLVNSGVIVLENQKIEVSHGTDSIDLIGLADPSFTSSDWFEYENNTETKNLLDSLVKGSNHFKILLSHRPELFDVYSDSHVNLVFSGHAHGGQFRLPFIGGLYAPNQGFFPKLTAGIHTTNNTSMIISRGLGNSVIPVRIFNRPELVVVTLETK